jgi:hypothetical protein
MLLGKYQALFPQYCYAVESFGIELQLQVMKGAIEFDPSAMSSALSLSCSDFGYTPVISCGTRLLRLDYVPNVFQWANRLILASPSGEAKSCCVPHCTALRVLMSCLYTGWRLSSARVLDQFEWCLVDYKQDSFANMSPKCGGRFKDDTGHAMYPSLHLARLFLYEQVFQQSFADTDQFAPVKWSGDSKGHQLRPMFRSCDSGLPIGIELCRGAANVLINGFDEFRNAQRDVRL